MHARLRTAIVAVATVAVLALSGCAAESSAESTSAANESGQWPRTIEHKAGTTEIDARPERIVSTSLTLTGTLLAIDAPVVATATTTPSEATDENGFFSQWADVAVDRGVEELYPNLEFDEESVIASDPDLIIVSSSGADATADQYDKLSAIAPTIVLDYGETTWQKLAEVLGEASGHEADAEAVVASFDKRVKEVADAITVPAGTANAIVWNGASGSTAFAKPTGSHGELLASLGFDVQGAPDGFDTSEKARQDFAFVSIENVTTALSGETVFIVSGDDAVAADLLGTAVLANAPAVAAKQVYPLGDTSFRIDYYSGSQIVDTIEHDFA